MVSISASSSVSGSSAGHGLRPVNLRSDLGALADLIELAFADTMDSSGRAAIREMRTLSRIGIGKNILFSLNEVTEGVGLGFVWEDDGRIVGNASIYPAQLPTGAPKTWIIANVAVHPDYRGRGIAKKLMLASMDAIRSRSQAHGAHAILQVLDPNPAAQYLYEALGFRHERLFTVWRRPSSARTPLPLSDTDKLYITRRRGNEWRAEYDLAAQVRPAERGGIGWLRPLLPGLFRRGLFAQIGDALSLRGIERLVIRDEDTDALRASMWIETGFGTSATQLTLLCDPDYDALYGEALLHLAMRRYSGRSALTIEHPADDEVISAMLRRYSFSPQRTLIHMRWDG